MSLLDELPHKCMIFRMTRTPDGLAGSRYGAVVEQTDVECWEQQASASEVKYYEKRGIKIGTKIYFVENPNVTERHCILITERNGEATANLDPEDVNNPDILSVKSYTHPDASAGLGILWKVMCDKDTGASE